VAFLGMAISEGISGVLNGKIVDELYITSFQSHCDFVLHGCEMHHVKRFRLHFGHWRDT
jgi:hypothetical protein